MESQAGPHGNPESDQGRHALEHLRAFWSQCEDEIGRKVSLQFQGLKVPRAGRIPREPLTDEEFNELYRAATNPELQRAMLLARREGLTPKQMLDLVVPDTGKVDLSRFRAAPSARLGHFPFERDGAFPAQC